MVFLLILYEYLMSGLYDLLGLYLPSMLASLVRAPQVSFCMPVIKQFCQLLGLYGVIER